MAVGGHRAARGVGAEEDVGAKSECQDDQEGQFGSELDAGLTGCLTDTLEDVGWRWAMENVDARRRAKRDDDVFGLIDAGRR